jgi:bacterioferritin-associated ferredoxin
MYACLCRAVTEKSVREVVAAGASTVSEVRVTCGAGTGCGGCLPSLRRLLRECRGSELGCTATSTLDPCAGLMESTCSGNCAETTGPLGEPICVAGLAEPVEVEVQAQDQVQASRLDAYGLTTTISFA